MPQLTETRVTQGVNIAQSLKGLDEQGVSALLKDLPNNQVLAVVGALDLKKLDLGAIKIPNVDLSKFTIPNVDFNSLNSVIKGLEQTTKGILEAVNGKIGKVNLKEVSIGKTKVDVAGLGSSLLQGVAGGDFENFAWAAAGAAAAALFPGGGAVVALAQGLFGSKAPSAAEIEAEKERLRAAAEAKKLFSMWLRLDDALTPIYVQFEQAYNSNNLAMFHGSKSGQAKDRQWTLPNGAYGGRASWGGRGQGADALNSYLKYTGQGNVERGWQGETFISFWFKDAWVVYAGELWTEIIRKKLEPKGYRVTWTDGPSATVETDKVFIYYVKKLKDKVYDFARKTADSNNFIKEDLDNIIQTAFDELQFDMSRAQSVVNTIPLIANSLSPYSLVTKEKLLAKQGAYNGHIKAIYKGDYGVFMLNGTNDIFKPKTNEIGWDWIGPFLQESEKVDFARVGDFYIVIDEGKQVAQPQWGKAVKWVAANSVTGAVTKQAILAKQGVYDGQITALYKNVDLVYAVNGATHLYRPKTPTTGFWEFLKPFSQPSLQEADKVDFALVGDYYLTIDENKAVEASISKYGKAVKWVKADFTIAADFKKQATELVFSITYNPAKELGENKAKIDYTPILKEAKKRVAVEYLRPMLTTNAISTAADVVLNMGLESLDTSFAVSLPEFEPLRNVVAAKVVEICNATAAQISEENLSPELNLSPALELAKVEILKRQKAVAKKELRTYLTGIANEISLANSGIGQSFNSSITDLCNEAVEPFTTSNQQYNATLITENVRFVRNNVIRAQVQAELQAKQIAKEVNKSGGSSLLPWAAGLLVAVKLLA
jgi:hypothetical protein